MTILYDVSYKNGFYLSDFDRLLNQRNLTDFRKWLEGIGISQEGQFQCTIVLHNRTFSPKYTFVQELLMDWQPDSQEEITNLLHENGRTGNYYSNDLHQFFPREDKVETETLVSWIKRPAEKRPLRPIIHFFQNDVINEANRVNNRYLEICDNSIWNYYLSANSPERLRFIVEQLIRNSNLKLYDLLIAQEYADFYARLTRESYLIKKTNDTQQTHADFISPFLFHSEYKLDQKIKSLTRSKNSILFDSGSGNTSQSRYKWRFLLLDDCANRQSLATSDGKHSSSHDHVLNPQGKLNILLSLLKLHFRTGWCEIQNQEQIQSPSIICREQGAELDVVVFCAEKKDIAYDLLKEYKFDIILLDYYLGTDESKNPQYGYQFLENVYKFLDPIEKEAITKTLSAKELDNFQQEVKSLQKNTGPDGRFYFMFTSAFTTAIHDRLLQLGYSRSKNFWHIGQGACPTNTPRKFLYYLLLLMEKRLDDLKKFTKHVPEDDHHIDENIITCRDLLSQIFGENIQEYRKNAIRYFDDLLILKSRYKILERDVARFHTGQQYKKDLYIRQPEDFKVKGSVLIYTMFPDIIYYSNSFWEHLIHLIYQIAYGTVRQWPEMWEEYMFIKPQLRLTAPDCNQPDELCQRIEKYIVALKK